MKTPMTAPVLRTRRVALRWLAPLAAFSVTALLASCTDNRDTAEGGDASSIDVASGDKTCELSKTTAPSGHVVFNVKNTGERVTEFYLLADDKLRIVGEVENIGPGITRKLVVSAAPGDYFTTCKPGMTGDGIVAAFKVTDSGADLTAGSEVTTLTKTAVTQYKEYVEAQTEQLVEATKSFAAAYKAGDDDAARAQYASTRMHWERIEPVAESFGDLDPKLDLREADLEPGQKWTGWHLIEKDLWPPANGYTKLTTAQRDAAAAQLVADTEELEKRVEDVELSADKIGNGAKELLDEVATGKVTGEEEVWSHADLWDFQANVEGAKVAFEVLDPVLKAKGETELSSTLTDRFDGIQALLETLRSGDGFVTYDKLTKEQVKELSDAVSALGEPLSRLTEAVVL